MNNAWIWAIAQKDIRAITSNKNIRLVLFLFPILFCVLIPTGGIFAVRMMDASGLEEVISYLQNLPPGPLKETMNSFPSLKHQLMYLLANYLLAPLFLLVPVILASLIACNSFVGEKERRTLESLLYAPVDNLSLFVGKVLASLIPTLAVTGVCVVLYGGVVNTLAYPLFVRLIFPAGHWLVMILWVVPAFTLLTVLFSVWVSARVKTFQEAQQIGGLIVLPIVAMVIGQVTGALLIDAKFLTFLGAVVWVMCILLLLYLSKAYPRHVLFERQVN